MTTLAQLQGLLDLALAAVLAAMLGVEREMAGKPAGLRTHLLVAIAVALFVLVGRYLVVTAEGNAQPDPVRMLEAIATGVSFLGAGTIIFRRDQGVVEGLTTAASLLLVSAIAMATALELYVLAVGVTAFALIVLHGMRLVEAHLPHESSPSPSSLPSLGAPPG